MNTTSNPMRRVVAALAAALGLVMLAGCDEGVQVGGVGASVGLPTAFTNSLTDTPDTGVGNVHWVGNPRW